MCVSQTVKIIFEAWFYNLVGNSAKDKIDKMKKKKKVFVKCIKVSYARSLFIKRVFPALQYILEKPCYQLQ